MLYENILRKMGLLEETKRILNAHKIRPKKRFGQNFLIREDIMEKMISYASINEENTVLEIGAGLGFLTERLAKVADQVIAVEIDSKLVRILARRLRNYRNVIILKGNVLRIPVPEFNKVVSVPPYSISSPLIFWLFKRNFECAVLTFQEEFARRLAALPGTKDYGRLTVSVYYYAESDLLDFVPRECFWPAPEVNSIIVRLRPRNPPFHVEDEEKFFDFIRAVFTQKNKKLRNAVQVFFSELGFSKSGMKCIVDSIPFHHRRVRELMPEELGLVFNYLAKVAVKLN